MRSRYTLLYIYGSGRCGSTLLDLLLNGHPEILGLGEISTLNSKWRPLDTRDAPANGFEDTFVRFWGDAKRCYEAATGQPFDRIDVGHPRWAEIVLSWGPRRVGTWARRNAELLSCLQEVSGARILSDASKWHHRLYLLWRSGEFDVKVIHLVRDGRAVVNSYVRRYNTFAGGLRVWVVTAGLAFWLRRRIGQRNWLRLRYEDLATDAEVALRTICKFLGVSFSAEMLAYRSHPYFGCGGNPAVRTRGSAAIELDEQWKWQLSRERRFAFNVIAGWLNRLYGYTVLS